MAHFKTYNRKDISRILTKASEIQTTKDLFDDQEGLTEAELMHVAEEVGISKEALKEALLTYESTGQKETFSWLNGTSRLQTVSVVQGELTDSKWEKVVQEIRRVTGGIGKTNNVGSSFEWEQRRREIGYKHLSLSRENNKTRIQFVSNWGGVKRLSLMFSFMIPFALTAIGLDGAELQDIPALLIAIGGGTLGLPFGMLYLKNYFNKQKKQIKDLFSGITKIIKDTAEEPKITIEQEDIYHSPERTDSAKSREKNT